MGMVYSTCQRELGDSELAHDATQAVFLLLAQKAKALRRHTHLPAWLFNAARLISKNIRRSEQRRQRLEQVVMEETLTSAPQHEAGWEAIDPFVNDALAILKDHERDTILLRYFEERTLADTSEILGISQEAARKRIIRSLEKMRTHFRRCDVAVSISALSLLLAAHAAKAVPAGCEAAVQTLSASTVAESAALSHANPHIAQITQGTLKSMKIASLKSAASIGIVCLAAGGVAQHLAAVAHPQPIAAARKIPLAPQQSFDTSGIDPNVLTLLNKVRQTYTHARGLTEDCEYHFSNGDKYIDLSGKRFYDIRHLRLMSPNLADYVNLADEVDSKMTYDQDKIDRTVSDGSAIWYYTKFNVIEYTHSDGFDAKPIGVPGYSRTPFTHSSNLVPHRYFASIGGVFTPGTNFYFNVYQELRETVLNHDLRNIKYSGKQVVDGVTYDVLSFPGSFEGVNIRIYIGADNFLHIYKYSTDTQVKTFVYKNIKVDQTMTQKSFKYAPPPGTRLIKPWTPGQESQPSGFAVG